MDRKLYFLTGPERGKRRFWQGLLPGLIVLVCLAGFVPGTIRAQEGTPFIIHGRVTDPEGNGIAGVSVFDKNTPTIGTTTDNAGRYALKGATRGATLTFRLIGYTPLDVPVNGREQVDATLYEDSQGIEEVVVIGYGSQKRGNTTTAIAEIDPEEIADLPVGNLGGALRGMVTGLSVSGGMTRPGTQASLTIRSPFTLSKDGGNNAPLYVIDDVIQVDPYTGLPDEEAFNNLDPSEIESIVVLKDAAAAIYGARASQGAVVVTTKRGKEGVPRVSYSGLYGWNDATCVPDVLNAYEYGLWMNTLNGIHGANRDVNNKRNFFQPDELEEMKHLNYNWLDKAWRAGWNMRHTVNVSGGSERATYFGSATYYTQDGNLGRLDYDKWTFRAGVDVKLTSNFKVGIQLSGDNTDMTSAFNKIGGESNDIDYQMLLGMPRHIPWEIDGQYVSLMMNPWTYPGKNANSLSSSNYFQMQNSGAYKKNGKAGYSINLNAQYDVPFVKGLSLKGSYAKTYSMDDYEQIGTAYTLLRPTKLGGSGEHLYTSPDSEFVEDKITRNGNRFLYDKAFTQRSQMNLFVLYDRTFGKHNISGMFTVEKSEGEWKKTRLNKEGPLDVNNGLTNTATGKVDGQTEKKEMGTLSYLGRISYSYADKYLAQFVFRTDASTKFSPDNYWGFFPSLSVGWVISKEDFFKVSWVDFLKFRFSAGLVGKDNTKPWQWRQRYTYQANKGVIFGTDPAAELGWGLKMEATPNPNATWDTDYKYNFGIDAAFLENRLSTTIEMWYDHNTDMLMQRTANAPITIGGSLAEENYGAIDAYGVELAVTWRDKIGKDFRYSIGVNTGWSDSRTKVADFPTTVYPWTSNLRNRSRDNGKWGYDCLGMFRTQEDIDRYVAQYGITKMLGKNVDALMPGMLYYRDVRGAMREDGTFEGPDGIIDSNDQIKLKKKSGNVWGFTTNLRFEWKGISLSAQIAANWGGWAELDARDQKTSSSSFYYSPAGYWRDMFDIERNPNGKYPNIYQSGVNNVTSNFWEIPSFRMSLRTLTLAYVVPKKFTEKLNIGSIRVNVSATNLANFYNPYDYRDPNTGTRGYPTLRTVSVGLNLTL